MGRGTSAGAVNAVALAAGLAEGGREGARAKLKQVWEAVHKAGVPDLLKLNPIFFGLFEIEHGRAHGEPLVAVRVEPAQHRSPA